MVYEIGMSTRIHGGILFNTRNIFTLQDQIMEWRSAMEKLTLRETIALYAERASSYIDQTVLKENYTPTRVLSHIRDEIKKEKSTTNSSAPDMSFEVTIFPHNRKFYGMIFCSQNEWSKKFIKKCAQDFSYWDNTDKPDEISEAAWDRRRQIWDEIFDYNSIPSLSGFTAICTVPDHMISPTKIEVLSQIPLLKTRATKIAKKQVIDRQWKLDDEYLNAPEGERSSASYYAFLRAAEWIETDEAQCLVALEASNLMSILPEIDEKLL